MNMVNAENAEQTYLKYHKDSLIEEFLQKRTNAEVEEILVAELEKRGIDLEKINQFVVENNLDKFPNGLTYANLALRANRAMALLIDYFYILCALIIFLLIGWISKIDNELILNITSLIICIYFLIRDALPNGQSFGKKSMQIKVISSTTGKNCTIEQSIIRNIVILIPFFNMADFLYIGQYKRQRIGDIFAGTMVVDVERK